MRGSEFAELNAFVAVARERSFRRAAQRLGLSPSALSHTIRALEERLGVRLLHRTTRSVAPTEAGAQLYARLDASISEIEGAVAEVGAWQHAPRGRLRLTLPRPAADLLLAPALGRFAQRHPEVELDLTIDDAFADVVADGFDAGIRPGESVQGDMVAVRLTGDLPMAVVGAPAYFAGHAPPQTPLELAGHACINYRFPSTGALYRWSFVGPEGDFDVAVEGCLTVNDTRLVLAGALQGTGLAYLPWAMVEQQVERGELVRVLQPWCRPAPGFFLYYPGRRQPPAALRALIEFLKEELRGTVV